MRTIGTVGTIRSIRPVGTIGTINPFNSFDTLGTLRTFGARKGFSGARRTVGCLLLLPGRMIRALRLLTQDIRRDASGRISQTAVIRMLYAVSRYRF